jgi:hypothetical protein
MAHQGSTHGQNDKAGMKSGKSSDAKSASSSASAKSGKQGSSQEKDMKTGQQDHKNKH